MRFRPEKEYAELNQHTYVKEAAISLWEGLPRVILAGVIFSLVCIPSLLILYVGFLLPAILTGIFMISPAWAALNAQIARIVYREPGNITTFFSAFARFYGRSLALGALVAVPLIAASLTLPALSGAAVSTTVWIGLGADAFGLLLLACLYIYAFPILVIYDANVRLCLQNSLILAARYLWNTLGLIAMAVLLGIAALKISYFLLVIIPACWLVFVMDNCRMVLRIELGDEE